MTREEISTLMTDLEIPEPKSWRDLYTEKPKSWSKCTIAERMDYIATRIVAMNRKTTSHKLMREERDLISFAI